MSGSNYVVKRRPAGVREGLSQGALFVAVEDEKAMFEVLEKVEWALT